MEQFKLRDERDPAVMLNNAVYFSIGACCSNNPSKLNATLPDSERKAPCGFGETFYCLNPTVGHFPMMDHSSLCFSMEDVCNLLNKDPKQHNGFCQIRKHRCLI